VSSSDLAGGPSLGAQARHRMVGGGQVGREAIQLFGEVGV
jgi:hypothetical protein